MQTDGLKVLIIEERREIIVFLANNIFKPKGFKILTARDGKAGLRKALEETPDLIIVDLNVPRMRGLDVIADLRDRGAGTPFIVITLYGSVESAVQAFRLGAKDYLLKPLSVADVETAITRALKPQKEPANLEKDNTVETLKQKAKELETLVAQQQEQLKAYEAKQTPDQELSESLKTLEAKTEQYRNECTRLNALVEQQKQQALQSQNSAKALTQFIIAQHKEMVRQKKDAEKLVHQVNIFSDGLSKFATKLDKQAHQFEIISTPAKG